MARIKEVDYNALAKNAGDIRSYAQELNNELTTAYQKITDMHNVWYGQRYNSLVTEFNNITTQLNDLLNLVVGEIPFTLETIANNYSQADMGANVTSAQQTAPSRIMDIAIHNDVGMRFLTGDVESIQSQVSSNLDNAKSKMETIESTFKATPWESEAHEAYQSKLASLKSSIVNSFENIKSQFAKLMTQTQEDVQNAETSNTVQ